MAVMVIILSQKNVLRRDKMLKEVLEREIKSLESHLDWLYYLLDTEKFEESKDPKTYL